MAIGRGDEARADEVVEAVLGPDGDYDAGAGDRALEGVAHQPEEPAPALEDLDDGHQAPGFEVAQSRENRRGAADEHPAVGGPPQDSDGLEDRPDDERIVVRERLPGGRG